MRSGVGYDKGLANDMGALQVRKAHLELAPCDELLRQGDLPLESRVTDSGSHRQASAMTAIESFMPGMRTGNFAP